MSRVSVFDLEELSEEDKELARIGTTAWFYMLDDGRLGFHDRLIVEGTGDLRYESHVAYIWHCDWHQPWTIWDMLIEATVAGAKTDTLYEVWKHCNLDDLPEGADAETYYTAEQYAKKRGIYLQQSPHTDDNWMADGMGGDDEEEHEAPESPVGIGETKLEAMSSLCKALGFEPTKTRRVTFAGLMKALRVGYE